jgi:flagellar capping protein FliD
MNKVRNTVSQTLAGFAALAIVAMAPFAGAQTSAQDDKQTTQSMQPTQEDSRVPPSQTPQPMHEPTPESMPRSDESMSRSEEPAMPPEDTLAEANTGVPAGVRAKFEALDTDHDGSIDKIEAAASDVLASQFSTLDSSGDGKLSLTEFAAASNIASIRIDHAQRRE